MNPRNFSRKNIFKIRTEEVFLLCKNEVIEMPLDPSRKVILPELITFLKNVRTLHNQLILISRLPLTGEQEEFINKAVVELSETVNDFLVIGGEQ